MTAPKTWPIVLAVLAVLIATPTEIRAQEPPPVDPGARVRVSTSSAADERIVGTLASLQAEVLVLDVEGQSAPVRVPLGSVTGLEVHTGRKSRALLGAGIGFGLGGAVAVLLLTTPSLWDAEEGISAGVYAYAIGIWGGIGAGLGALVGLLIKVDRWEAVPLDQVRISQRPPRLTISASLVF